MADPSEVWTNVSALPSLSFTCGYCNNLVATKTGYMRATGNAGTNGFMYLCPHCNDPTIVTKGKQIPGVRPGESVQGVPDDAQKIYDEARDCMAASAYTAAAMLCRKLLMHFAVDCGAQEGLTFKGYVDYLVANNYVPPGGKDWVDHIREKGNDVNHQLIFTTPEEASDLLGFVQMLLKFKYEFQAKISKSKTPAAAAAPSAIGAAAVPRMRGL